MNHPRFAPVVAFLFVLAYVLGLTAIGCTQRQINTARDAEAFVLTGEQIGCMATEIPALAPSPAKASGAWDAVIIGCHVAAQLRDYARRFIDAILTYAQKRLDARSAPAAAPPPDDAGPTPTEANGWQAVP